MNEKKPKFKGLLLLIVIVSGILISALAFTTLTSRGSFTYELKTFSSYEELSTYLKNIMGDRYGLGYSQYEALGNGAVPATVKDSSRESADEGDGSVDYSTTNIQVEGVDEPDIVKTDGTYLYVVSGQSVYIILAYPAEDARILSKNNF